MMMKNCLSHTILCLSMLLSASPLFAQLTGTKTIGGTSPDYTTFISAVVDLNLNGVGAGGVTFVLRDGNYSGSITIQVTGTQANPIVFQSENLNASLVTITNSNVTDVIIVDGVSYITFRALTIDHTGTSNSAFELRNNSDYVTITDCILDGPSVTGTTFNTSTIYANENSHACENFVVQNCTIRNGSYGIYFGMTLYPTGVRIENTRFEGAYGGGIYLQGIGAPVISGNTITTTQTGNSSYYGIYLNDCDGKNIVTENYIYTSGSGEIAYGINLNGSASTSGNNALIANNSIQVSNTLSIAAGIEQSNNSTYYDIIANTIYVSGGTSSSTFAYRTYTFSDDTKIKDNIFANAASGTGISSNQTVYIANATGVSEASHNNYWTANTGTPFRGYYGGNAYTSIANYTTALGEVSAMNVDPMMTFVPNVGWKATNSALTGSGVYFPTIPSDIDGITRLNPTTIGAHENGNSTPTPPANDDVCNAATLTPGVGTSYTNVNATAELNEPAPSIADCATGWCAGDGAVQNSVWYTFTLAQAKKVSITTTGFDNQIALYTATSCSTAFTIVAANDNSGSAAQISSACLQPGTYYLQLDGFQGASGSGTITLTELTLSTPVATAQTNNACTSFTANWNGVSNATAYFIDVATDNGFTNLLPGYNNLNAGSSTSYNVTGLTDNTVYYYRVRATDGCTTTANSNATFVTTLEIAAANFQFNTSGLSASFTNNSTGAASYLWNFGDSNTSTATNPNHTYASQGNYQVQLIATNTCGSDTATQTVNLGCSPVTVNITANGSTTFCEGDSVTLATVHSMGNSYQWLKDNQPISGAQTFNYTALESGSYTLSVTNMSNCSGVSNQITVVTNQVPAVAITANGTTTFCTGGSVQLTTNATGTVYQWLNNTQPINNANSTTYSATTAGNYSLRVTDANSCSGTSNVIAVTVSTGPTVTITANGATSLCVGDDVELSTSATGLTYQWLNNASPIANANSSAYTATTAGSYALSVTDGNNCTATSNTITVTVNNLPSVSLAEFDTVCYNAAAFTLSGGVPAGGTYFVEGIASTSFDPKHGGVGAYEVEYTYTDGNNCTASASRDIIVDQCLGIEDILNGTVSISPNPASEFLTVKISDNLVNERMTAYMYDAAGKEIIRQVLANTSQTISVKQIPAGMYLIRIMAANKTLHEAKISVTH